MGLSGLEPPTSRLSGVRSNRLSYKPLLLSFGNTIASLRKVCLFSNFRLRFARFHQVLCGNTIASLRYARCACFLTSDFAFARLR